MKGYIRLYRRCKLLTLPFICTILLGLLFLFCRILERLIHTWPCRESAYKFLLIYQLPTFLFFRFIYNLSIEMSKILQTLITLLIIASLILQILVLLGNFNGLRSVNIVRVMLENTTSTGSGGILSGIFSAAQNVAAGIPNYLTVALFVVCEGRNDHSSMVCSPASFGYRYSSKVYVNYIHRVQCLLTCVLYDR